MPPSSLCPFFWKSIWSLGFGKSKPPPITPGNHTQGFREENLVDYFRHVNYALLFPTSEPAYTPAPLTHMHLSEVSRPSLPRPASSGIQASHGGLPTPPHQPPVLPALSFPLKRPSPRWYLSCLFQPNAFHLHGQRPTSDGSEEVLLVNLVWFQAIQSPVPL